MTNPSNRTDVTDAMIAAKTHGERSIAKGVMPNYCDGVELFKALAWTNREAIIAAMLTAQPQSGEVGVIRYLPEEPTQAQRDRARESDLYNVGDMVLAWVNKGDLYLAALRSAQPVDHISKLKGERDRLREALEKIEGTTAWGYRDGWEVTPSRVRQIARAALNGSPPSDNKGKNDG